MSVWSLGLGGSDHDFSAALMHGADLRVAIEQERLSRQKHAIGPWFEDPYSRCVDYCLSAEGITLHDVRCIVSSDLLPMRVRHRLRGRPLKLYPHHLCHAASAYIMLPLPSRAGILVIDGFGSAYSSIDEFRSARETISAFVFDGGEPVRIAQVQGCGFNEQDDFPTLVTNSVGTLYEFVTTLLGYDPLDAGKTMGLSSYGTPRYISVFDRYVQLRDEASNWFACRLDDPDLANELLSIINAERCSFEVRADLAASVQHIVNRAFVHAANVLVDQRVDVVCLSGGCALNTVATSWLIEHSPLRVPIVVAPHCGDAGVGIGALWLEHQSSNPGRHAFTFRGGPVSPGLARPGRVHSATDRRRAVQHGYPRLVADTSIRTGADLARLIASGSVVGVVNGGSEVGPRALGGRSIFADPRDVATRERINREIKHREPFRPLAPIVLESEYEDYFEDLRCADPFMLKVARAKPTCRELAPAIVHVDGTARVQTVPENGDPVLVDMLRAFRRLTGVGVLINTSFNRRGEPIVESPLDAVDAFLGMGLDGLYLDGDFYWPVRSASPSS
jgi:carbamoyltransferase